MKSKGFTLIELMGVLVILGLVITVSSIIVVNQIDKSKDKISAATEKLIFVAADNYIEDNINDYPKINNNLYCISISTLINNNLLEKSIIDSERNLNENYFVKVTVDNFYDFQIVEECVENN